MLGNAPIYRLMLDSTTEQRQITLSTLDGHDFVMAIRDSIVLEHPQLGDDPALLDRLAQAYVEAERIGLVQHELLAEFLRLEAKAPGFYQQSAIAKWLRKRGASTDDRFRDLLDVLRKKLALGQEDF